MRWRRPMSARLLVTLLSVVVLGETVGPRRWAAVARGDAGGGGDAAARGGGDPAGGDSGADLGRLLCLEPHDDAADARHGKRDDAVFLSCRSASSSSVRPWGSGWATGIWRARPIPRSPSCSGPGSGRRWRDWPAFLATGPCRGDRRADDEPGLPAERGGAGGAVRICRRCRWRSSGACWSSARWPDLTAWVGIALICGAGLYTMWRETRATERGETCGLRQWCSTSAMC